MASSGVPVIDGDGELGEVLDEAQTHAMPSRSQSVQLGFSSSHFHGGQYLFIILDLLCSHLDCTR